MRPIISRKSPFEYMYLIEEADIIGAMRGLELVEMEKTFMGYILSIDSWMSKGELLLCESG